MVGKPPRHSPRLRSAGPLFIHISAVRNLSPSGEGTLLIDVGQFMREKLLSAVDENRSQYISRWRKTYCLGMIVKDDIILVVTSF